MKQNKLKRILSLVMAFIMILGMLPANMLTVVAATDTTAYDGVPVTPTQITSENYAQFGLTADNWSQYDGYYGIRNAKELYGFANLVNGIKSYCSNTNAVLLQDIVVNETVSATGATYNWTPIGLGTYQPYSGSPFYTGTFDGNGHTISGLYCSTGGKAGLFAATGYSQTTVIKNMIIENSYFSGTEYVGAIISYAHWNNTTIQNCKVSADVTVQGTGQFVGGIIGGSAMLDSVDLEHGNFNQDNQVENCVSFATVSTTASTNAVGVIAGAWAKETNYQNRLITLTNCYYQTGRASNASGTVDWACGTYATGTGWASNEGCTAISSSSDSHTCIIVEHKAVAANCTYPGSTASSFCLICGEDCRTTIPTNGEHHYVGGDCVNEETCALCGTKGNKYPDNHTSDKTYYALNESDPEKHDLRHSCCHAIIETEGHVGGTADCITKKVCTVCTNSYGVVDENNHANTELIYKLNETDNTKHDVIHKCCGATEPAKSHNFVDSICTSCGVYENKDSDGICLIYTAQDLVAFATSVNSGFTTANAKLMNDIDMSGITFYPIAPVATLNYSTPTYTELGYEGTFDGGGYTISNLTITRDATKTATVGLFGTASGTVKNLHLDKASYTRAEDTDGRFSVLVGQLLPGGQITDCIVTNSTVNSAGSHVGGAIAGCNYGGTITRCVSYNNTVSVNSRCGNLVGDNKNDGTGTNAVTGTVIDCYSDSSLAGGNGGSGTVTGGESNVTTERFASGEIAHKLGNTWGQKIGTDAYPVPGGDTVYQVTCVGIIFYSNEDVSYTSHEYVEGVCRCGAIDCANDPTAHRYTNGFCVNCGSYQSATLVTEANYESLGVTKDHVGYYAIANAGQLYWFGAVVNSGYGDTAQNTGINGVLTANITDNANLMDNLTVNSNGTATLKDGYTPRTWAPIGGYYNSANTIYTGIFDGNGKTVSGLYVYRTGTSSADDDTGFFGNSSGTVKNVSVVDSYFRGDYRVGGIVGYNKGNVMNCHSSATVGGYTYNSFGGVVGSNESGSITNCFSTGSVIGNRHVGGVVGSNESGSITNCFSVGSVSSSGSVGGVVGYTREGSISNCYFDSTKYTGGAVGGNYKTAVTSTIGKTTEQFASGEVAYLLQGSQSTHIWGQLIDTDTYPVLGGEKVYYDANKTPQYYNYLHEHSWTYTKVEGENKITATCANTDQNCSDTNGGYVTISAPTETVYTGSAIAEDVINLLKTGDEISVVYTPTDKLTDGEPVNAGTYTATVTLGEGTDKAEISVSYEITKAVITDISEAVNSVTAPAGGNAPDTAVDSGTGYTAEIKWNTTAEKYDYNTEYTATLTLTPDTNHTFGTVSADGWEVSADSETGVATLTRTYKTAKAKITSVTAPENKELNGIYTDVNDLIATLDQTITITAEDETTSLAVSWSCGDYSMVPNAVNTFTWTADADNLDANGNALTGTITVTNGDAIGVVITGTDKDIEYKGNKYDVSDMFEIDKNAGTATYSVVSGGTGAGTLDGDMLTITKAGTIIIQVDTEATGIYAPGKAQATLTVAKGTGSGTVTIEGWTYGNDKESPVPTSVTNGTTNVTYKYAGTGDTVYEESETAPTAAGTYKVTATFAETDLYNACTDDATFTIAKRRVTAAITVNDKDYDGTTDATVKEITLSGALTEDVSLTLTGGGLTFADEKAGENKSVAFDNNWTLTGSNAENYILAEKPANATATIRKVALTIAAKDNTIIYGEAPANAGVSYNGFVNGETADDLGGTLAYEYSYEQYGDVGEYTITPSGLTSDNYEIKFVPGKLTVEKKVIGIEWGDTTFTYDDNAKLPEATATGAVNGDVIALTVEGAQTEASASAYTATVTGITGDKADNYKLPADVRTTFTIRNASQKAPEVGYSNETVDGANDGKITGVDSTMEWRADGIDDYTAIDEGVTELAGLADGTYYVRYAAKENYDASPDATVVIGTGNKLMVTVPANPTGYTLTVDKTALTWNDSVTLTFTLADGYSKVDGTFAVKVNSSAVELNAAGKYTVSNVQSDVTITVEGVADITAPEAEIKIGDNFWNSLLNKITFGKFFKETQKVEITAADVNTGSGLDKIYYYIATEEVSDFTSVTWTEYTDAFNINPDNEYIIYAKATDHAGNAVTISSEGLVLDATAPTITGIENGGTYYGDTTVTATDKYLDTVVVDGKTVTLTDGKYTIQADNAEHTVKATDKSGNVTEYKITVYKIHTVTYKADGVVVAEIPVNHGSDVTNIPEIPVKEGYTQIAPTWDKDGKNITDDTTINAVYTINEYTVTYRASGDTIAEIPVKHGGDVTNVPAIPEKTGYTQTAPTWEQDGKNITEDTEINAVYVINKYYVTYKADGETVDILAVNHGSNVTDVPEIPVKEGYTQTAPTWDNDGKNITDHITINAVYTINKYTVNYVANGVTVDTQTVEHGKNATAPAIPEKTGYTQTAPVWDKDGKNITDDTTITAVYTINKYTVTYKADGEVVDTQTVEHGSDAVVPAVPVKEGYDQIPGQWSHNGKNITADTTINAVYSINGYTITVPETQTGYTLTVDKTYVEWGSDAVLTFTLADGYSKTETFAVKINGSTVEIEEDGTYTIADIKSDAAITVEGVADITAPEATIKIGDNFWNSLLNKITFGKFFKETQKVEITAADVNTGSGLDKIYYYLAAEEVTDLTSVVWTEYTGSFNIEPNAEVIIYAWAEDHAGNDKYISSEGLVLDSIAPVITGITDGATYYGTVGYEVDETYVASVTDNDSEVTLDNGKATIAADGKAHVIIVTDKAGNTATVTVTVKPVEDIDDSITVDDSNVTSDDKEEIQGVIDSIDNILNEENSDLTEEEKAELEELREEAQDLLDKIAETEKAVEDVVTDADGFKADEVTSDDKDEIEDLIKEIEDLIASDNTTDEQKTELEDAKEALKDRVQEIEDAAQAVEDAKAPVKDITSDNVTADDSDELEKAKETLDDLKEDSTYTEEEKAAIQEEIDRITELEEVIAETEEEVKDIEEKADALDPDKVTSSDKAEVEQFITEMEDKLSDPNMTEEQKERVEESIDEAESIIEKIDADQKALEEALTDQKAVTEENVTGDDSEALADAKETLEELKQDDNYTVAEKEAIQEEIDRITELEEKIAEVSKEVSDLKETADGYDKDTVTSKDKDALEDLIEDAEALLETDNLTDEQKETVEAVKADAEELVKEIEDAASDITTEDVKEVEDITSENVGLDDKENLEEALEDLKAALEENDGNYTDEEKAAIEEDIARMEDALESIEKAEGVIEQITELPAAEDIETDDEDVVADVQEIVDAYDKLTDHEKSLIDEELISKLEDVQDKLSAYAIIKGADGSYTKGSKDGLEFTANGAFSKFTGIKVDGTVVAEDNYTAEAGSTVITLKASYLETLTTGKHELTAVYTDGDASCNFEVKAQVIVDTDDDTDGDDNSGTNDDSDKGVTSPDTGDHSNVGMWSILMMLSAAGIITIVSKKRKRY